MKLFELSAPVPSRQAANVFESYFGDTINVDIISAKQARTMLEKVRKLANAHRQTREFHTSEQDPAYLKLMMMEQVLATKIKEVSTVPVGAAAGSTQNVQQQQSAVPQPNPTVAAGQAAAQAKLSKLKDPQQKTAAQNALKSVQTGKNITDPAQQQALAALATVTENSAFRRQVYSILRESEVQQAQVVLAAQDMVDNVQKMLEQVTSMQFKDLPALIDQIKNQIGVDQAMQFNTDATAALAGLVQNLQQSKQQLDAALGTVTGQDVPTVPGIDDGMAGEMPEEPMPDDEGLAPGIEEPEEPESPEMGGAGLGRAKR